MTLEEAIERRKRDHINIHLEQDVQSALDVWAPYRLRHKALPEVDRDEVNTRVEILGTTLEAPIVVSSMTGGFSDATRLNGNIAKACAELGVGMGVGSQRAALEKPELRASYEVVKEYDPPLVLANLGAPQLVLWGEKTALAKCIEAVEMVDADVLAIHLNYLQECIQPEGDTRARGALRTIESICKVFRVPVVVKETGAGIDESTARALLRAGVKGIDVGGLGGTTFSAVEAVRAEQGGHSVQARMGATFREWGIPTPVSIQQVAKAVRGRIPIVATGGVRTGLDGAKALALGADLFGVAGGVLKAANESAEAVKRELQAIIEELKTAMMLTGCRYLENLWDPDIWLSAAER